MPVRSSTSSVLRWPDRGSVVAALEAWAAREAPRHAGLLRLGYFGSYARGDWGVGSDVDLIAIIEGARGPIRARSGLARLADPASGGLTAPRAGLCGAPYSVSKQPRWV
jgi:hypothetical protein